MKPSIPVPAVAGKASRKETVDGCVWAGILESAASDNAYKHSNPPATDASTAGGPSPGKNRMRESSEQLAAGLSYDSALPLRDALEVSRPVKKVFAAMARRI